MAFSTMVLTAGLANSAWAEGNISAQRQQELLYLLQQDCGSCHGLTLKGGLGSPLLPINLAGKPDAALVEVIMQGLPGTPMPPWRFLLEEKEAAWLVWALKTGQTMKATP
ncbi:MAG: cytochrome c [Proteobacteria bacterium]|nr:cytochrome c [Pseudomonadota bacterium]